MWTRILIQIRILIRTHGKAVHVICYSFLCLLSDYLEDLKEKWENKISQMSSTFVPLTTSSSNLDRHDNDLQRNLLIVLFIIVFLVIVLAIAIYICKRCQYSRENVRRLYTLPSWKNIKWGNKCAHFPFLANYFQIVGEQFFSRLEVSI